MHGIHSDWDEGRGGINDTVLDIDTAREKATGKLVRPRKPRELAEAMVRMGLLQIDRPGEDR